MIGFVLTLFAAASWAMANLVMRASGETRPLSLLVWSSLVPPLPLLGLAGVVDGGQAVLDAITGLSWRGLLAVAYVAYVSTLVGFGIWNRLIAQYSIARVAPFSLLVPVFGLSAAWLLLDEPVGPTELAAAADRPRRAGAGGPAFHSGPQQRHGCERGSRARVRPGRGCLVRGYDTSAR